MSKEIELANQKEDRKHLPGMIIFFIVCGIVGGFIGFGMAFLEDMNVTEFLKKVVSEGLMVSSIYVPLVLAVVGFVFFMIFYGKAKKLHGAWDGDDEGVYQKMEMYLSYALYPTVVTQVLALVFMAIGFGRLEQLDRASIGVNALIFGVGIILSSVFMIVGQVKVVNFEKVLNPEKKGSALDLKFQDKFMDSFDEAELFETYKASFEAYKATNTVCMLLWFVCLLGMLVFDFGMVPVCMVGIIWLTSTSAYFFACIKSAKNKK